jgi:plasmid maintenance system antidote protein VapI
MKLEIEIDDTSLNQIISNEITAEVKDRIKEYFLDDAMSKFWKMVDKEIDAYIKTPEFETVIKKALKDSEKQLIKAAKNRMLGNW